MIGEDLNQIESDAKDKIEGPGININRLVVNNQVKTEWKRSSPVKTYSKKTSPSIPQASMGDRKSRYGRSHKPKMSEDYLSTDKKVSQYLKIEADNQMHYFKNIPYGKIEWKPSPKAIDVVTPRKKKVGRPRKSPELLAKPSLSSSLTPIKNDVKLKQSDLQAPVPTSTQTLPIPAELMCLKKEEIPSDSESPIEDADWNCGDLAWATIAGFPYWPCTLTKDPFENIFRKNKIIGRGKHSKLILHVRFFGDNGRRSWVQSNRVMPFQGHDAFQALVYEICTPETKRRDIRMYKAFLVTGPLRKVWQAAVSEAESLMESPRSERILYFQNLYPPSPIPQADDPPTNDSELNMEDSTSNACLDHPTTPNSEGVPNKKRGRRKKIKLEDGEWEPPLKRRKMENEKKIEIDNFCISIKEEKEIDSANNNRETEPPTPTTPTVGRKRRVATPKSADNTNLSESSQRRKTPQSQRSTPKRKISSGGPGKKSTSEPFFEDPQEREAFKAYRAKLLEQFEDHNPSVSRDQAENYLRKTWASLTPSQKTRYYNLGQTREDSTDIDLNSENNSDAKSRSQSPLLSVSGTTKPTVKRAVSLFAGIKADKVCQVCFKGGEIVKCRGSCLGHYHKDCAWKNLSENEKEQKEVKKKGRKKKFLSPVKSVSTLKEELSPTNKANTTITTDSPKRRRGRPRKYPRPEDADTIVKGEKSSDSPLSQSEKWSNPKDPKIEEEIKKEVSSFVAPLAFPEGVSTNSCKIKEENPPTPPSYENEPLVEKNGPSQLEIHSTIREDKESQGFEEDISGKHNTVENSDDACTESPEEGELKIDFTVPTSEESEEDKGGDEGRLIVDEASNQQMETINEVESSSLENNMDTEMENNLENGIAKAVSQEEEAMETNEESQDLMDCTAIDESMDTNSQEIMDSENEDKMSASRNGELMETADEQPSEMDDEVMKEPLDDKDITVREELCNKKPDDDSKESPINKLPIESGIGTTKVLVSISVADEVLQDDDVGLAGFDVLQPIEDSDRNGEGMDQTQNRSKEEEIIQKILAANEAVVEAGEEKNEKFPESSKELSNIVKSTFLERQKEITNKPVKSDKISEGHTSHNKKSEYSKENDENQPLNPVIRLENSENSFRKEEKKEVQKHKNSKTNPVRRNSKERLVKSIGLEEVNNSDDEKVTTNKDFENEKSKSKKSLEKEDADNSSRGSDTDSEAKAKNKGWMCKCCSEKMDHPCFICGKTGESRIRCSVAYCGKSYHLNCVKEWPQSQLTQGAKGKLVLNCPQHACHTCISDNPSAINARFTNDKLVRCVKCPTTYHYGNFCIPAGSEILSSSQINCPRHYVPQRKGTNHVNAAWCFICAMVGGSLICCDLCPTSFHAECLKISPPEGAYICEDCETGRFPLYGEIVWVKLGAYRWWPAKILFPSEVPSNIVALPHSTGEFAVKFFGSHDYYWVNRGRVFLYHEGDGGKVGNNKSRVDEVFMKGIEEASLEFAICMEERATREASSRPSLKPPKFVKIQCNRMIGAVKNMELDSSNMTPCECKPNQKDPCGPESDCLNRLLMLECNSQVCPAGENCKNQNFEKRIYPMLAPFRTDSRGWGLKTLQNLKKGDFVIEYVGEMIDEIEYKRRLEAMQKNKEENFYFLTIDKDRMLDAGPKGNMARFMNHSCDPNCETQKWTVNGDTRVGLFALKDITAGSELVFNYNLETIGNNMVQCKCGASNCVGFIGAKQPKPVVDEEKKKPVKKKRVKKVKPKSEEANSSKVTEDKCFTCDEGGELLLCDDPACPKAYHLSCLGLTKHPAGGWVCPWHQCSICSLTTEVQRCSICINSYCKKHAEGNIEVHKTRGRICFVHTMSETSSESSDKLAKLEDEVDPIKKRRSSIGSKSPILPNGHLVHS